MSWFKQAVDKMSVEVSKYTFIESQPPGMVAIASGDMTRFALFSQSLNSLDLPPFTQQRWGIGGNVANNLNQLLNDFLANPKLEWIWLIGDDHEFDSDIVLRLLSRNVGVVVPLCCRRKPTFGPVAYYDKTDQVGMYKPVTWDNLTQFHGLMEVYAVGQAGMLLRRSVVEKIAFPYFELGQIKSDRFMEDIHFCEKLQSLGENIYLDLDAHIGHCGIMSVRPARLEGNKWGFKFGFDKSKNQLVVSSTGTMEHEMVEDV